MCLRNTCRYLLTPRACFSANSYQTHKKQTLPTYHHILLVTPFQKQGSNCFSTSRESKATIRCITRENNTNLANFVHTTRSQLIIDRAQIGFLLCPEIQFNTRSTLVVDEFGRFCFENGLQDDHKKYQMHKTHTRIWRIQLTTTDSNA